MHSEYVDRADCLQYKNMNDLLGYLWLCECAHVFAANVITNLFSLQFVSLKPIAIVYSIQRPIVVRPVLLQWST